MNSGGAKTIIDETEAVSVSETVELTNLSAYNLIFFKEDPKNRLDFTMC